MFVIRVRTCERFAGCTEQYVLVDEIPELLLNKRGIKTTGIPFVDTAYLYYQEINDDEISFMKRLGIEFAKDIQNCYGLQNLIEHFAEEKYQYILNVLQGVGVSAHYILSSEKFACYVDDDDLKELIINIVKRSNYEDVIDILSNNDIDTTGIFDTDEEENDVNDWTN